MLVVCTACSLTGHMRSKAMMSAVWRPLPGPRLAELAQTAHQSLFRPGNINLPRSIWNGCSQLASTEHTGPLQLVPTAWQPVAA